MKLISWNVNGIRAAIRNGLLNWLDETDAYVVCLQEVKAFKNQVPELNDNNLKGWHVEWNAAEKAGYSGVITLSREKPLKTEYGFGREEFDREGRVLFQEYKQFYLYNIYFPNGQRDQERLDYKMNFYDVYLEHAQNLRSKGKAIITCGDFNTAHKEIDLKNPKANEKTSGFLPIERAWMDKLVNTGYVDTFRIFNKEAEQYSWWTYRFGAREKNVGWRIDYFFIDQEHVPLVKNAFIHQHVKGSDHCPVGIELTV
ncbi:MAG: exodeoxyribonuclease III [Calditrichaceae bacterium]|nr:exodeoxyribonuclease III [Calditrichaceae bacterium]MBN2710423.1 exodeoxyribonuclease III [Calditrichaceae bacterium]RQV93639.1 MAG: exodeoxyribonuclease III [Calditrichota bacterium]